jgi:hypothetical protein
MTAQAASAATPPSVTFVHLVDAEARRTVDSRAGFWLLTVTLGVVVLGTVAVLTLGAPGDVSSTVFMLDVSFPLALALPVIAILLVCSERSPRGPALGAKALVCAAIAVGVPVLVATLGALSVLASAASQGVDAVWDVSVGQHVRLGVFALLAMAAGYVAAVVVRRRTGALVTYAAFALGLPALSSVAGSLGWYAAVGPWIDLPTAMYRLQDATMPGEQWLHLAAASVLWLVVPAALGLRRALR